MGAKLDRLIEMMQMQELRDKTLSHENDEDGLLRSDLELHETADKYVASANAMVGTRSGRQRRVETDLPPSYVTEPDVENQSGLEGSMIGEPLSLERVETIKDWIPKKPDFEKEHLASSTAATSISDSVFSDATLDTLGREAQVESEEMYTHDYEVTATYYGTGLDLLITGDFGKAEQCFKRAFEMGRKTGYPHITDFDELDVQYRLAVVHLRQSRFEESIQQCHFLVKMFRDTDTDRARRLAVMFILAQAQLAQGMVEDALAVCREIVRSRRQDGKDTTYYESVALMVQICKASNDDIEAAVYAKMLPTDYEPPRFVLPRPKKASRLPALPQRSAPSPPLSADFTQDIIPPAPSTRSVAGSPQLPRIPSTSIPRKASEATEPVAIRRTSTTIIGLAPDQPRPSESARRTLLETGISSSIDDASFSPHKALLEAIEKDKPKVVAALLEGWVTKPDFPMSAFIPWKSSSKPFTPTYRRASLLAEHGADTALHAAARYGRVDMLKTFFVQRPEEAKTALVLAIGLAQTTPLHDAIACKQLAAAEILIENDKEGANFNTQDAQGRTPLHRAAQLGLLSVLQVLLARGPSTLAPETGKGSTALSLAVTNGHTACVRALLTADTLKQTTQQRDKAGETPMLTAVRLGNTEALELILENDASGIAAKDETGCTALHLAVRRRQQHIVRVLLRYDGKGEAIRATDTAGHTALEADPHRGRGRIGSVLRERTNALGSAV